MVVAFRADRETHQYWVGTEPVMSVTDYLAAVGAKGEDGAWHSLSGSEDYERYASDPIHRLIGTELHALAAFYVQGQTAEYDERLEPWVPHLRRFIDSELPLLIPSYAERQKVTEQSLYNDRHHYAQTADLTMLKTEVRSTGLTERHRIVTEIDALDWKFTKAPSYSPCWRVQVAAYADTIRQQYHVQTWPRTWVVNISQAGPHVYPGAGLVVRASFNDFLSVLNVYRTMNSRKKEAVDEQ